MTMKGGPSVCPYCMHRKTAHDPGCLHEMFDDISITELVVTLVGWPAPWRNHVIKDWLARHISKSNSEKSQAAMSQLTHSLKEVSMKNSTGIWIKKSGARVPDDGRTAHVDGSPALGVCDNCNVSWNDRHECECGEHGGAANDNHVEGPQEAPQPGHIIVGREELLSTLARMGFNLPTSGTLDATPKKPKFAWVRPLAALIFAFAKKTAKPVPKLAVWAAQLATIFWLVVQVLPENPLAGFEWANEMPEGFPFNYVAASAVTLLFLVWSVVVVRSGPVPPADGQNGR